MPLCRRRGDKGEEIRGEGGKGRERQKAMRDISGERYAERDIRGETRKESDFYFCSFAFILTTKEIQANRNQTS